MRQKRAYILLALAAVLILAACASPQSTSGQKAMEGFAVEREVMVERAPAAPAMEMPAYDSASKAWGAEAGLPGAEDVLAERMIIRTGNLSLVVRDTTSSVNTIQSIITGLGGYVVNSNLWESGGQVRANMSVRVPAASFDAAMGQIKDLATVVKRDNTSGQDVTEEHSDLGAQLRNLEATETELRELLKTVRERTGKAEDILAVYRELTEIRGRIERIQGRMQYLERMTAMATINIDLEPDIVSSPISPSGWRPTATLSSALQRLVGALQSLVDAFIWIVFYLLPIALIILGPIVILLLLVGRWVRRKKKAA